MPLPQPINWQDFQILIAEVARVKYVSDSIQEFGRQGQRQSGVDIYATDLLDQRIGIQCKETKKNGLTDQIISKEIEEASRFKPSLDLFILATTQRTDAKLQEYVNETNKKKHHKFRVQIWFWDDVNREVNRSQAVMSSCYKTFLEHFSAEEITSHLAGVRIAFDRPAFTDNFLHERNYDDFENALVDTKAMLKTGFLYDRWTRNLVAQVIPSSLIGNESYQKFIQDLEKTLDRIYREFQQDKKATVQNPHQLEERAGDYNISRRKLLATLNERLREAGMPDVRNFY